MEISGGAALRLLLPRLSTCAASGQMAGCTCTRSSSAWHSLRIPALTGDLAAYLPTGPDFYSFSLPFLKKLIGDLYS